MNAKKFFYAMGAIDTKYVDEALNYKKKTKRPGWIKWGTMVACLVLIVSGIFMFCTTHNGMKMISQYGTNSKYSKYPVPSAGEIIYEIAIREAREKYLGKDVTYLLAFQVFENEEILSGDKQAEEYQRLIAEGYELYMAESWTYQGKGEKKYYPVVVGCFTEDQLSSFKNNPQYGYFFYFATNGDDSGISVNQNNFITDFPLTSSK
jgi:hypothetical protein